MEDDTIGANNFTIKETRTDTGEVVSKEVKDGEWSYSLDNYSLADYLNGDRPVFHVEEDNIDSIKGVVYSKATYDITVTPYDKGNGKIGFEYTKSTLNESVDGDGEIVDGLDFTNIKTKPGRAVIEATKSLTGMELDDGAYQFVLLDAEDHGKRMTDAVTGEDYVTNNGGNIIFTIDYDQEVLELPVDEYAEFYYDLAEIKGSRTGMDYDGAGSGDIYGRMHRVKVTVHNDGTELTTDVEYDDDAVVKNVYTAKGEASITVGKKVVDAAGNEVSDYEYPDGGFVFSIKDLDTDKVFDPIRVESKDQASVFTVSFNEADLYLHEDHTRKFEITEKPSGTALDDADGSALVTFELEDLGDGNIDVKPVISTKSNDIAVTVKNERSIPEIIKNLIAGDSADVIFINKVPAGKVSIEGAKTLRYADGTPAPLTKDVSNLTFTVTGAESPVSGVTDEYGNVKFGSNLTFTKPGTYTLKIIESLKSSASAGFNVWGTDKTIKVTVSNKDGELYVSGISADGEDIAVSKNADGSKITFTAVNEMEKTLQISKEILGATGDVSAELTLYKKGLIGGKSSVAAGPWKFSDGSKVTIDTPAKGTYILSETYVPEGYEKADDVELEIFEDGTYRINSETKAQTAVVPVTNQKTTDTVSSISITKNWNGMLKGETVRPTATAQIYQRAKTGETGEWGEWKKYGSPVPIAEQKSDDGKVVYKYTRDNLPGKVYDRDKNEYVYYQYKVDEVKVDGYKSESSLGSTIGGYDYSFSGLKTSFLYTLRDMMRAEGVESIDALAARISNLREDMCAGLQTTVIDILLSKLKKAAKDEGIKEIAVAGGVSANSGLRQALLDEGKKRGWNVYIPPFAFTTDNAAMIGAAAYYKYLDGDFCSIDEAPFAKTVI